MFLGTFFIFFGIGTLLGLAWVLVRYGLPLLALLFVTVVDVAGAWARAFKEGWERAGQRLNAAGKPRRGP